MAGAEVFVAVRAAMFRSLKIGLLFCVANVATTTHRAVATNEFAVDQITPARREAMHHEKLIVSRNLSLEGL